MNLGRTIKGVLTQGAIGREFKEIKEFREALSKGYKWSKGYKGVLSHKHKKDRGKPRSLQIKHLEVKFNSYFGTN